MRSRTPASHLDPAAGPRRGQVQRAVDQGEQVVAGQVEADLPVGLVDLRMSSSSPSCSWPANDRAEVADRAAQAAVEPGRGGRRRPWPGQPRGQVVHGRLALLDSRHRVLRRRSMRRPPGHGRRRPQADGPDATAAPCRGTVDRQAPARARPARRAAGRRVARGSPNRAERRWPARAGRRRPRPVPSGPAAEPTSADAPLDAAPTASAERRCRRHRPAGGALERAGRAADLGRASGGVPAASTRRCSRRSPTIDDA